jgi:hypothetical protein
MQLRGSPSTPEAAVWLQALHVGPADDPAVKTRTASAPEGWAGQQAGTVGARMEPAQLGMGGQARPSS